MKLYESNTYNRAWIEVPPFCADSRPTWTLNMKITFITKYHWISSFRETSASLICDSPILFSILVWQKSNAPAHKIAEIIHITASLGAWLILSVLTPRGCNHAATSALVHLCLWDSRVQRGWLDCIVAGSLETAVDTLETVVDQNCGFLVDSKFVAWNRSNFCCERNGSGNSISFWYTNRNSIILPQSTSPHYISTWMYRATVTKKRFKYESGF